MKDFIRENQWLSLCGLNCGLCTMRLGGHCPGCGGGSGNQSCRIAKCSLEHGKIAYCHECGKYPCEKYEGIDAFDSFITHKRQKADLQRAAEIGIENYNAEQKEKAEILHRLLADYNDGRKKNFFCLAVNLLPMSEISAVMDQIAVDEAVSNMVQKEKSAYAAGLFREAAGRQGIELKLRKKTAADK